MDKNDNQDEKWSDPREELANDVALLYSWAKVGETTYREFSGQRKRKAGVNALEKTPQPTGSTLPTGAPEQVANAAITDGSSNDGMDVTRTLKSRDKGPVVGVFSIAGGVGKSTLCVNLAKALCCMGEHIVLVDATSRGFLPFYFGATERRAGTRRFSPPAAHGRFVDVVTTEEVTQDWLEGELKNAMNTSQRIILDLGSCYEPLLPRFLSLCSLVLVPILPDLNSILTMATLDTAFASAVPPAPAAFFVLNCFDPHSANDRRVHELVEHECGDRLLPVTLRRSRELREALSGGIPGADHSPGPELSHDFMELALWVRSKVPLSATRILPGRWSEQ